jgi:hypothetical protein
VIKIRDKGTLVTELQTRLADAGYLDRRGVDGRFGPQTDSALRQFQKRSGLVADGIYGPKTADALLGKSTSKILGHNDIEEAANALDVDTAAILAVNEVESRGQGFLEDGRPVILVERHWMVRRLRYNKAWRQEWSEKYPNVVNVRSGGYTGGPGEWERLGLAWSIHPTSALESASWGLFQIMGFHWELLGYESIQAFVDEMRKSEGDHLKAFVRFIKADPALLDALQGHLWGSFANIYNGPAYAKNSYDVRLQAAYDRHSAATESAV